MRTVKFVSYSGKYPNLCRGVLTLNIDGKTVTFCPCFECSDFPASFESGGCCGFREDYGESYIENGSWKVHLPEQFKDIEKEAEDLFNENVEQGCCGGCL